MLIASTSLIENESGFLIPSARGNNIIVRGSTIGSNANEDDKEKVEEEASPNLSWAPHFPAAPSGRRNVLARGAHYESGVGAAPILFKCNARRLAIGDCEVLNSNISCRLLHHKAALLRKPFQHDALSRRHPFHVIIGRLRPTSGANQSP